MYDEKREYWNDPNAMHMRMMLKTCGLNDKDIKRKPYIGVANAYNSAAPGHAHLRQLAEQVKQGIWAAGGIPVEFGIPSTCGEYANGNETLKYEQAGRDVVCMAIEFVTNVHKFDGLVILSTCDLIISGSYLAAMRLDIPTVVVTGGSMQAGCYKGQTRLTASALDCAVRAGAPEAELSVLEEHVCPSFGACPTMGTACTMQMIGEVLNLVMPGTSIIPANDNAKLRSAMEAGVYAVELTKKDLRPSQLITKETLLNAIMFDTAVAGSTNAILHILTYAYELGIEISLDDFAKYAKEIPLLLNVIPSGPYTVTEAHDNGGVPMIMKMLESKLYTDTTMITGQKWSDFLANLEEQPSDVIHSLKDPVSTTPGLQVLRGNLSPNGAIVRPTAVPDEMKVFHGPAKVYECDQDACVAVEKGEVVPGDVIVIRYEGCKGAPGMKEVMLTTDILVGKGLHKSIGLVTDARFSGFNYGGIIGHVSPEAFDGGPIAIVENGDEIFVDIPNGIVELRLPEEDLRLIRHCGRTDDGAEFKAKYFCRTLSASDLHRLPYTGRGTAPSHWRCAGAGRQGHGGTAEIF